MKKILGLGTLALAGVLAFTGCSCSGDVEKTATSYGIVHKQYLGVATVTHTGSDVTDVVFDEVMLPANWAVVKVGSTNAAKLGTKQLTVTTAPVDADVVTISYVDNEQKTVNTAFTKYIKIGDIVFGEISVPYSAGAPKIVADYQSGTITEGTFKADGKIDSLYAYIQTDIGGKWYYDTMKAGNYNVLSATGTSLGLTCADGKGTAALKSTNGYGNADFVWADNMNAMADYIVENDNLDDMNVLAYAQTATDTETGKKYFATSDTDVVTGATLLDFYDYMTLAQAAYKK